MLGEAIKQIAGCRLFASSFLADLRWRIRQIGLIAFGQDGGIACFPVGHLQGMQALATKEAGLLDSGFALGEQPFHLSGPGLLLLFVQKSQLAQMMDVTERMLTGILPIGSKAIMATVRILSSLS